MVHSEWDAHRAEIERIYRREGRSLEELSRFMETTYGFRKTKYQYEANFKKWGIKKYRMGAKKWKYVKRQIVKRNAEQKRTEVYIDGILCPPETVQMEVHRQGFEREIEKYYEAPSPKAPEGVIVCSPGPSAFQLLWPPNLPWFTFSNAALMSLENITDNTSLSLTSLSNFQEGDKSLQVVSRGLFSALSSLCLRDQARLLRVIRSGSRVASALSSIMPEQHEGQIIYIAECLCRLRGGSDIVECLRVALFLISNNFHIGEHDESSKAHPWGTGPRKSEWRDPEEEKIRKEDQMIMEVFHMSGLNTLQSFRHFLSVPGVTAQAIAQKLFASAVRTQDLKTIRVLLKAGMSPDTPVLHDGSRIQPLVLAAQVRDSAVALEMSRLLLSHNAGCKKPIVLEHALYHAIKSENQELVKNFLSRGVPIAGESLEAAIGTGIPSLFQILLDTDCNVNKRATKYFPTGYTTLGVAVKRNDIPLTKKLLALGAEVDALQPLIFREEHRYFEFETTPLGLAAKEGNDEMINHLLAAHANVNYEATTNCYIPPLALAVGKGHKRATQRLLAAGADISTGDATLGMTLVQRALYRHDLEMSRMLMANGASVDGKLMEDYYTSILYQKAKQKDLDTVSLLLGWGARVDEIHDEVPDTVLGVAISLGHCEMIQTLLQAGASNPGRMLIEIGNLKTAKYLEQLGILSDILLRCGQPILVSAIREESCRRGDGLTQYLLDLDIDRQRGTAGLQPFVLGAKSHSDLRMIATSPLGKAIAYRNVPLAKTLIERGAPVTDLELTEAVEVYRRSRNYEFLSLLLCELSRNPCAVPNAFEKAMRYDKTVFLVQHFLDAGLDPRGKVISYGYPEDIYFYQRIGIIRFKPLVSVLEPAIKLLDDSTFKTLLRATTWTATEKGRALTLGLCYENQHLVQDLLDTHADVNQEMKGSTPLLLAIQMQDIFLMRRLIAAGADLHGQHMHASKILESAVRTGNERALKDLIEAGANVPCYGQAALQLAVKEGNVHLVDMLLDAGADVNQEPAKYGGATALQFAAIQGYIGIARKLLDRGADVNAAESIYWGRTALEGAAEHGRIDMLQLLLNEGALIEGPGRTQYIRAIKLAEKRTHYAAAQLLRDYGGWNDSDARRYELLTYEHHEHDEQHQKFQYTTPLVYTDKPIYYDT